MRIIISPAKKMKVDTDTLPPEGLPAFLPQAERLLLRLREFDLSGLQALWKCGDALAAENIQRLQCMDLHRHLTPAILAYDGIQYWYMAPGVFEEGQFAFVQEHLRILSGFYGLLRPMDGIVPYRLEMQARLAVDGCRDLYAFWGDRLARALAAETDLVLNLASREYSRAVQHHLPPTVRFLTCSFGQARNGKIVEKGTLCKMARGRMVRWLATCQITRPQDITAFRELDYCFSPAHSTDTHYQFLKASGGSGAAVPPDAPILPME